MCKCDSVCIPYLWYHINSKRCIKYDVMHGLPLRCSISMFLNNHNTHSTMMRIKEKIVKCIKPNHKKITMVQFTFLLKSVLNLKEKNRKKGKKKSSCCIVEEPLWGRRDQQSRLLLAQGCYHHHIITFTLTTNKLMNKYHDKLSVLQHNLVSRCF